MATKFKSPRIQRLADDNNGKLPAYAWPGGYQMFYIDQDNSILCPGCANNNDEEYFPIVAYDINYEDETMYCDECSAHIPGAYGDDED